MIENLEKKHTAEYILTRDEFTPVLLHTSIKFGWRLRARERDHIDLFDDMIGFIRLTNELKKRYG